MIAFAADLKILHGKKFPVVPRANFCGSLSWLCPRCGNVNKSRINHVIWKLLGESGCDAWTLARIAGHSSVAISSRYVHPSEDAVLAAFSSLGGHNSGHSEKSAALAMVPKKSQVIDEQGRIWCARRDSNSRPIAPEAIALSI